MPPNLNKQTPRPPFEPFTQATPIASNDILVNAHIHIDTNCYVDLTIRGVATLAAKTRLIRMIELTFDPHMDATRAEHELIELRRVMAEYEQVSQSWNKSLLDLYNERDEARKERDELRKELDAVAKEHVIFKTGREGES